VLDQIRERAGRGGIHQKGTVAAVSCPNPARRRPFGDPAHMRCKGERGRGVSRSLARGRRGTRQDLEGRGAPAAFNGRDGDSLWRRN
jgi:hypothetical protein